jgi:hypothetical protein
MAQAASCESSLARASITYHDAYFPQRGCEGGPADTRLEASCELGCTVQGKLEVAAGVDELGASGCKPGPRGVLTPSMLVQ